MKLTHAQRTVCVTQMPPTRGHDLKLKILDTHAGSGRMPPTRGHDLKPASGAPSLSL